MLAILFLLDTLLGHSFDYLLSRQRSGMFYRANYIIKSCKEEVLVFGSSRASHHYNPDILGKRLDASFYNCGQDAQGLVYSCAMITAVVNRYKPKLVIIDINPTEFTTSEVGKLNILLPYHTNPVFQRFISYNGKSERLKLMSGIYPYNSQFGALLLGLDQKRELSVISGYLPLQGSYKGGPALITERSADIKSIKIELLEEVLTMLENKDIPSLLVTSPVYGKVLNNVTDSICKSLANKYLHTSFISFCNNNKYSSRSLFKDNYHLNSSGAIVFSNELLEEAVQRINYN